MGSTKYYFGVFYSSLMHSSVLPTIIIGIMLCSILIDDTLDRWEVQQIEPIFFRLYIQLYWRKNHIFFYYWLLVLNK